VRHDLLYLVRVEPVGCRPVPPRLDVEAGQLTAQQQGRPISRDGEVGDGAEPRQRRVAAHVPDRHPLHGVGHAEVAGEHDVEAGRRVSGTRDDGEQPDVGARDARAGQRCGRGLLAEGDRLLDEPLHPSPGAPRRDVLDSGVDDAVPAPDACGTPDTGGAGVVVVDAREVLVPQGLLVEPGGRHGRRDRRDMGSGHHRGTSA
jgi:hypothetical protein